jgi:hypothetical protein
VSKNLRTLQSANLVKSKSYKFGGDKLWAFENNKIVRDLGYTPPKEEVHFTKYDHEIACGDVFVTLSLTGKLTGWSYKKAISKEIVPDRIADYGGTVYIEVEMGSKDEIKQKAEAYRQYYFEKKEQDKPEQFQVWFLVGNQKLYDKGLHYLANFSSHYSLQKLDEFHQEFQSDTE